MTDSFTWISGNNDATGDMNAFGIRAWMGFEPVTK
jgi:hypothetical protein